MVENPSQTTGKSGCQQLPDMYGKVESIQAHPGKTHSTNRPFANFAVGRNKPVIFSSGSKQARNKKKKKIRTRLCYLFSFAQQSLHVPEKAISSQPLPPQLRRDGKIKRISGYGNEQSRLQSIHPILPQSEKTNRGCRRRETRVA